MTSTWGKIAMIKSEEMSSEVQKVNPENTDAYKAIKPQELLSKVAADV